MKIEDYINEVIKQIQSPKNKKSIEAELHYHLNQSKKQWIQKGYTDNKAEEKAIKQMGNPTILGNELHKLHSSNPIMYVKPFIIHLFIGLIAAFMLNIMNSFEQIMIQDNVRNILSGFVTVFILCLYLVFGKRYLKGFSNKLLIKSTAIIFTINIMLGISGYLITTFGSGIVAENGQLLVAIFMVFNYGFYSIITSFTIPELLGILITCFMAPFLLYFGSRLNQLLKT
ncbi:hypothetical protein BN1058_02422 [Paraliobacillus sp. PM-2]|uniref:permease prefix domain 1-containing protein n=1 Tax=Paraliobacillus sp. PM-2 TaxID=1462524 RepID=UPI00061BB8C3|nr:permease prefix domain 1-containing protein [Paraliobacillus sp. PM-2]CQR48078.1 hypothetical protein BN1058_02422 [Paraliobacillus sp. PM-2]